MARPRRRPSASIRSSRRRRQSRARRRLAAVLFRRRAFPETGFRSIRRARRGREGTERGISKRVGNCFRWPGSSEKMLLWKYGVGKYECAGNVALRGQRAGDCCSGIRRGKYECAGKINCWEQSTASKVLFCARRRNLGTGNVRSSSEGFSSSTGSPLTRFPPRSGKTAWRNLANRRVPPRAGKWCRGKKN